MCQGDFCHTVDALSRIATQPRQPPEGYLTSHCLLYFCNSYSDDFYVYFIICNFYKIAILREIYDLKVFI